jgi:hypothetical protein
MKTEDELVAFYSDVITKKLEGVEELRIKTKEKRTGIVLGAIAAFIICAYVNPGIILFFLIAFGPIFYFLVYRWLSISLKEKYTHTFKKEIVGSLVGFFDDRLVYSPEKGIFPQAIKISGLFSADDIDDKMCDYVEGQLGETFIQFSKIILKDPLSKFTGIFMIASFNKYFKGSYRVIPQSYTGLGALVNLGVNEMGSADFRPIEMENPDFEKEFAVYGTDQVEARYILTPSMIERIMDFRTKVGQDIFFSFTRSRLFLAFRTDDFQMFEPRLSEQNNLADIEEWGRALQLSIGIVEEFGLNTRIWSKA